MNISLRKHSNGSYAQDLMIGAHTLIADAPVNIGGDDLGPGPHELFDASLASCKAITLMMFAKRQGMKLESVDVDIVRDASRERDGIYHLNVTLELHGELTDEERAKLLDVANRCPIHRLMTQATITVETTHKA
jgi:putative redox protein